MKHLVKDYHIDADQYQFIIAQKAVVKTGKTKGSVRFENHIYPSTINSVERFIATEGAKEWVNKDWKNMVQFVNEALYNFRESLPELIKKRYDIK